MNAMKRLLLIIDPQIDFINGSLPVPGAEEAMNNLSRYIAESDGTYSYIVMTADAHPYEHCSFSRNGGSWPDHCISDSVGAAVWPPLFDSVFSTSAKALVLHKGLDKDTEEYSIFKNMDSCRILSRIIDGQGITEIDICGLAGDVCVLDSIKDALRLFPGITIWVLVPFSPSIDGGTALNRIINDRKLLCVR